MRGKTGPFYVLPVCQVPVAGARGGRHTGPGTHIRRVRPLPVGMLFLHLCPGTRMLIRTRAATSSKSSAAAAPASRAKTFVSDLKSPTRILERRRSRACAPSQPYSPCCLCARTHSQRQRIGVYGQIRARMTGQDRRRHAIEQRLALGEWLHRELQRQAARRAAQA